tara:strand:+ start:4915 stop:5649 length:735 start_codon:yes stop_codon:yes gene_type:complete
MTLQGSGAISLEQIRDEFGQTGSISMSQLYKDGGIVPSTSTTTVGGSVPSLAGSPVNYSLHGGGNYHTNWKSQLTGTITCGSNGNVTANGAITFVNNGTNSDSATNEGGSMNGGVKIVSTDSVITSHNGSFSGTLYDQFTGSLDSWTCTGNSGNCDWGYGTFTTTIPNGTDLGIPNGVTSFKILTYGTCSARVRGDGSGGYTGYGSVTLGNPSGSITSTTTGTINATVPTNGAISFQNFYGATA